MNDNTNIFETFFKNRAPKDGGHFMELIERMRNRNREVNEGIRWIDDLKSALDTDKNLEVNPPIAKPYDRENGAAEFFVKGEKEYKLKVTLGGDYEFANSTTSANNLEEDEHHEWIEDVKIWRKYESTDNWEELNYMGDFDFESKLMSLIKIDWDEFVKEHQVEE